MQAENNLFTLKLFVNFDQQFSLLFGLHGYFLVVNLSHSLSPVIVVWCNFLSALIARAR